MTLRKFSLAPTLFAAALLAAPQAHAERPETVADLRCLAITMALAGSGNPKVQEDGVLGVFYYLGRVEAREPGLDLENSLAAQFRTLNAGGAEAQVTSCAKDLAARRQTFSVIAHDLQQRMAAAAAAVPATPKAPAPAATAP